MRSFLFAILFLLPLAVTAQDRAGNDTPGEWRVTHHTPFGLWDSFCDERRTAELLEQRCYLRYVEVFSPRPNFGAMFIFITPSGIEFGTERGTRFAPDGFRIEREGAVVWRETRRACLRGRSCTLGGAEADAFLETIAKGGALRFEFVDRHGQAQDLTWDLSVMDKALADHRAEARARGLL